MTNNIIISITLIDVSVQLDDAGCLTYGVVNNEMHETEKQNRGVEKGPEGRRGDRGPEAEKESCRSVPDLLPKSSADARAQCCNNPFEDTVSLAPTLLAFNSSPRASGTKTNKHILLFKL